MPARTARNNKENKELKGEDGATLQVTVRG